MKKTLFLFSLICITCLAQAQENRQLKYNADGRFKIVQLTDIHYQAGNPESVKALEHIEEVLNSEKPDLLVITGDLAWSKPAGQAFDEVLEPIIKNQTPWAVVFGNHDDEHELSRSQIMAHVMQKPYCMSSPGGDKVKGIGNYILEITGHDGDTPVNLLYFMDSGSYSPLADIGGYDWFARNQIDWYNELSATYKDQNNGTPVPALSFFHIPLLEYALMSMAGDSTLIGTRQEQECNGMLNTGMFAAMKEAGNMQGVFVGHDHDNDYIGVYHGIALAYGRFSGANTVYNNLGPIGCRVIELKQDEPSSFTTYIRLHGGEKLHRVKYPDAFAKEDQKD